MEQSDLTGTKAGAGRVCLARADLERQLEACRREIARVQERLVQTIKQQTATSEMRRIISNSPIQSVLDAVAKNAARLCDANNTRIWRLKEDRVRIAAAYGQDLVPNYGREGLPVNRDTVIGRATRERRTIHVHDLTAEDREYPVGSRLVKDEGYRTTLATPLLREGTPIGVILAARVEARPFDDGQIALLETFAEHAVIAIEIVRLFEAEKQRTQALTHANRDLRESEAKFRDYAETASDWFWEIGPDYKFTLLTENAFGSGGTDRIGTTCWDHALDLETESEKWRLVWATLDARKPFRDFVYRTLSDNGSPMYVRASGKPVFEVNGEFLRLPRHQHRCYGDRKARPRNRSIFADRTGRTSPCGSRIDFGSAYRFNRSRSYAANRQCAQQRPCGPEFFGSATLKPERSQGSACVCHS